MNNIANNPLLRFPGFNIKWENRKLGEIAFIYDGTHQTPDYVDAGVKFVSVENIKDIVNSNKFITKEAFEKDFKNKPQKDDILMTRITAGVIGETAIVKDNDPLGYYVSLALIRKKTDINVNFLTQVIDSQSFKHELYKRIIHVAFPKKINLGDIGDCIVNLPSLPEQTRISNFLTAVDDKLTQLKKKKNLLVQYKKGVMQKIFSQELRFKDENGKDFPDWDRKTLGEIAKKKINKNKDDNVKNVFTNSATYGIVNQRDFFDKDIANQNNLTNYYIVEEDDFIYNPRISNNAPVGPIKRNHLGTGVMSPLYSISKIEYGNLDFFEYYFETTFWHEYMESIANYGARSDRMNITTNDFYLLPLPFPTLVEQTKIANFLSTIDEKINHTQTQIEKTETWKKGLLQQMFV
jgi:type I restriction enzyme S subunit